ncbi:MAG: PAS domain S-box protein [Syntrophaceae bacterium]|nr:PAS domain S-box protein [Syntrophaceae bacterium]
MDVTKKYDKLKEEMAQAKRRISFLEKKLAALGGTWTHPFSSLQEDATAKRAGEAVSESELQYRSLIQSLQETVYFLDVDGTITFVSPQVESVLGYRPEEMIGKPFMSFIHRQDLKEMLNRFEVEGRSGMEPWESRLLAKDGRYVWVRAAISRQIYRDGRYCGISGTLSDVTERRRMEEDLAESRRRLANLMDHLPGMAYRCSNHRSWTLDYASAGCLELTGYAPDELIGKRAITFSEIIHPEDRDQVWDSIQSSIAAARTYRLTYRIRSKDGQEKYVTEQGNAIPSADGEITGLEGFISDITDQYLAESRARDSFARLRRALGGIIKVMASTIEYRDPCTSGHQQRVADLARRIAQEMGLPADQVDGLRMAGVIHDIGKVAVPAEILGKPSELGPIEMLLVKTHAQTGFEILREIEFPWPIARMVLEHHERLDGTGYPSGLKGDEMLLESKILAVADVVEAMCSHRPYRPALGAEAAMEEIRTHRGILYDATVVDACLRLFREKDYRFD